ncbi:uncharacterized protein HMPREF1541_10787 [Cyphellophora europaea CBS 101466]|uniref:Uncharacterized protein n=1 Tax=Cyphellophora europaea (strain CBS 101466) TaxID=1220924 RepID=W2S6A2_CYPE1|nr:uncharacterized protein HMPREF1541_10787 [Cyphellophora europaea CBS 101466]ETN44236.1 hypothetical protein HMPREF1541_10787 [Cyphellophora europaea CBS 101466]
MASIAQPWLINKFVDPLFSVAMGVTAAALRIQREEKEKHPSQDSSYPALWQKGRRMATHYFGWDEKS